MDHEFASGSMTDKDRKAIREISDILRKLGYARVTIEYTKGKHKHIPYEEGFDPIISVFIPEEIVMKVSNAEEQTEG